MEWPANRQSISEKERKSFLLDMLWLLEECVSWRSAAPSRNEFARERPSASVCSDSAISASTCAAVDVSEQPNALQTSLKQSGIKYFSHDCRSNGLYEDGKKK